MSADRGSNLAQDWRPPLVPWCATSMPDYLGPVRGKYLRNLTFHLLIIARVARHLKKRLVEACFISRL